MLQNGITSGLPENVCSCSENFYREITNKVMTCAKCPAESTARPNSVTPTDCKCNEGFYPTDENNAACALPDWTTAEKCDDLQYLNDTSLNLFDWKCLTCPIGASCIGPINFTQVKAKFGWQQCSNKPHKFSPCSFAGACLGGPNIALVGKVRDDALGYDPAKCPANETCKAKCNTPAYVNGSRLCGKCASNYSLDGLSGKCARCPDQVQNIAFAVLGVIGGLVTVIVIIQLTLSDGGFVDESDGVKNIGINFLTLIPLLRTFPIA